MYKIYVKTMGCSANFAESEIMAGLLKQKGSDIIKDPKKADIILINTCTVKGENTALKVIKKLPRKNLIIAGCVTDKLIEEVRKTDKNASFINTHNFDKITKVVENTLRGVRSEELKKKSLIKVCLPKVRYNKVVNIVPIASGCTSFCTYCSTKIAKGDIFSYPGGMIIKEIKKSLKDECREIWLTSQDNSDYGLDAKKKSQLPNLLHEINKIRGNLKVRVGMMNPHNIIPVLDDFIKEMRSDKMFKFLHIPVQSGNNNILRKMGRKYKVGDFKRVVNRIKKQIPDLTLSTDVIVGFPTETEDEFMDTIELINEVKPDVLNISRFVLRKGTVAERFKQHPDRIKKDRSRLTTKVFKQIVKEKNKKWIGWEGDVIIDEKGKNNTFVGRNYAYKPVIIKKKLKLGDVVKVKVKETTTYDLRA